MGLHRAIAGLDSAEAWIRATAARHGITAAREPVDDFADAAARLADADATLDEGAELLLAIDRAGLISQADAIRLHAAYIDQRRA